MLMKIFKSIKNLSQINNLSNSAGVKNAKCMGEQILKSTELALLFVTLNF